MQIPRGRRKPFSKTAFQAAATLRYSQVKMLDSIKMMEDAQVLEPEHSVNNTVQVYSVI